MKAPPIRAADFAALRRQLRPDALLRLVRAIEDDYRRALGIESWDDDSVVVAALNARVWRGMEDWPANVPTHTEAERAVLRVVRLCIAVREDGADARHRWHDDLVVALGEADPAAVDGMRLAAKRSVGGATTAAKRREAAGAAMAKLAAEATRQRKINPHLTDSDLARILSERGFGGVEGLRKRLRAARKP